MTKILPAIFIFLLCLAMATATVSAKNKGNGNGNGHGKGNGNGNGTGSGNGNGNGKGTGNGNGKGTGNGNGKGTGNGKAKAYGHGNNRKGNGNGKANGNGNGIGSGNWNGNDIMPAVQQTTSAPTVQQPVSTDIAQQIVSSPTVQAPVIALLIAYPAAAAVGLADGPAWWSMVESNAERLFRKFFFLSGSVGEKIRRKNVLRNGKRKEIYYFVVNNPFSHFRRITRSVGVGPNEGSWHLRILEKMGLIKSEHIGRYLTYHANNADYLDSQVNRPPAFVQNSNATKILEYLLRNPGTKITQVTQALMMNRNTVSYHVKRMQATGLIEREEANGLRLVRKGDEDSQSMTDAISTPMTSRIDPSPPQGKLPSVGSSVDGARGS